MGKPVAPSFQHGETRPLHKPEPSEGVTRIFPHRLGRIAVGFGRLGSYHQEIKKSGQQTEWAGAPLCPADVQGACQHQLQDGGHKLGGADQLREAQAAVPEEPRRRG